MTIEVSEVQQAQPGDTMTHEATVPGGQQYAFQGVTLAGLSDPVDVEILTPSDENELLVKVNGRAIHYDGEMTLSGDESGKKMALPDNWDYIEGVSRLARMPPICTPRAAEFEITAGQHGRNSVLFLNGQPLTWASRVILDVQASSLTRMTIAATAAQGTASGQAVPELILNVLGRRDSAMNSEMTTEDVLGAIEERLSRPGTDLVQGSYQVETADGPRLATFVMVLTEPLLTPDELAALIATQGTEGQP